MARSNNLKWGAFVVLFMMLSGHVIEALTSDVYNLGAGIIMFVSVSMAMRLAGHKSKLAYIRITGKSINASTAVFPNHTPLDYWIS